MKKLSLLMAIVMIISCFSFSGVFAASFSGESTEIEGGVTVVTESLAGKASDDAYYKVDAVATAYDSGWTGLGQGNTIQMQFALADESSVLKFYPRTYIAEEKIAANCVGYTRLEVSATTVRFVGGANSSTSGVEQWSKSVNLVPGRWYTLTAMFGDKTANILEGSTNETICIDGKTINTREVNFYGYRALSFGVADAEHGIYVDNIDAGWKRSESSAIDLTVTTPSVLTGINIGSFSNENGTINVPAGTTVAELKDAIATTDGTDDVVKVYNSTITAELNDADPAIGGVLVVGAKNGQESVMAYSYYSIAVGVANPIGLAGKNVSDTYETITTVCTKYDNGVNTDTINRDGNSFKTQFLLTDSEAVLKLYPRTYTGANKTASDATQCTHMEISATSIKFYGEYASSSSTTVKWEKAISLVPGRWYTLTALFADKSDDIEEDNIFESIYIDGKLINTREFGYYGFRGFGYGVADSAHPVALDNTAFGWSRKADQSKNTVDISVEEMTPSVITSTRVGFVTDDGESIQVPAGTTVAELKAALTTTDGTDDVVKICDQSFTEELAAQEVAIGGTLVVAALNGQATEQAYKYYTIEEAPPEVAALGGKRSSDEYTDVSAVSTSFETGVSGVGNGNTFQCQFLLKDENSVFKMYPRTYNSEEKAAANAISYTRLEISATSVTFYGHLGASSVNEVKWTKSVNLVPGRWYTLTALFGDKSSNIAEGSTNEKIYINGSLINSREVPFYGFRGFAYGVADAEHPIAVDDVKCGWTRKASSNAFEVDIDAVKASLITAIGKGMLEESTNKIYVSSSAKLSEVLEGLTTTDGTDDVIRVYNSDFTELIDDTNIQASGNVIVIASLNGGTYEQVYNYYEVVERTDLDEVFGCGKNVSDISMSSSCVDMLSSVPGNYGKKVDDDVYKLETITASGEGLNLPATFVGSTTYAKGTAGHIEFAFALEEGSKMLVNCMYVLDSDYVNENGLSSNWTQTTIFISKDKIASSVSKETSDFNVSIAEKQWYTLGIKMTTDNTADEKIYIYINGKEVGSYPAPYSDGFRRPYISTNGTIYLDNISALPNYTYVPANDTPSLVTADKAVVANGKVSYVVKPASVADYNFADTAVVRFYDENYTEVEYADAKIMVVADKDENDYERVLKYYAIDEEAKDVVMAGYTSGGKYYATVKTNSDEDMTLIGADYDNGILADLVMAEFVNGDATIEMKEKFKAFIWDSAMGMTPKMSANIQFESYK